MTQLQAEPPVDWHHAAIQYLEIDAALRDLATSADTAVTGSQFLESLRRCEPLLRFGTIQTSDGLAEYHSPATFDAEEFRSAVLRLFKVAPLKKVARPILNTPDSGTSIGSPPYSSPRTVHPAPQTDHDHPGAL